MTVIEGHRLRLIRLDFEVKSSSNEDNIKFMIISVYRLLFLCYTFYN